MVAGLRLRGRIEEMAALRLALAEASSGRSSIVVVEGEPGIGKSRLLAEAGDAAQHLRMQVVAGRAEELEQSRPFGVFARILGCEPAAADPRRAKIADLLAPHERGDENPITVSADPGLQHRAIDAIADLVEELALGGWCLSRRGGV